MSCPQLFGENRFNTSAPSEIVIPCTGTNIGKYNGKKSFLSILNRYFLIGIRANSLISEEMVIFFNLSEASLFCLLLIMSEKKDLMETKLGIYIF